MSLGVNTNLTGPALNALALYQQELLQSFEAASSGSALSSAANNPSGLAIYNTLTAQAGGFDTATSNVADAGNAINVAQGALSGVGDSLQQLNQLAIQGSNGFLSPSDRAALQAQANQLVQQINTDASQVNFNGQPLLTGQFAGTTPATPAAATVTANSTDAGGNQLVANATATAATTSGTIGISVVNTAAAAAAQVTSTDNATGTTTTVGTYAAGSTQTVDGTNLTFGNFTLADVGNQATVQTQAAQAGAVNPTLNVQSGANAGATTQVTIPNGTTAALSLQNIDLSTSASSTNAQGQIQAALDAVSLAQGQLDGQSNALSVAGNADTVASNNLTASASAIGSPNYASLSSNLNSQQLLAQISIDLIHNANDLNGHLNAFLSTYA